MKHMKNKSNFVRVSKYASWYVLMMFLMMFTPMRAQTSRSISGQIVDELGEAIIGANVTVVGNKALGTITDVDGNFNLKVPAGATLEISYIGYITKKMKLDNKTSYKIVLQEDSKQLDEVVVVGYGTQKKATITGAVSAVNNDEIISTKSNNIQNMLTGKLPGVRNIQRTRKKTAKFG